MKSYDVCAICHKLFDFPENHGLGVCEGVNIHRVRDSVPDIGKVKVKYPIEKDDRRAEGDAYFGDVKFEKDRVLAPWRRKDD